MTAELALALLVFFASHSGPALPPIRRWLSDRIGNRGYLALYSGLSLVVVVWLISAKMRAPYIELWPHLPWHQIVTAMLMWLSCFMLSIFALVANPMSIGRKPAPGQPVSSLLKVTRHPLLWSLALWSGAHTLANGDLASVAVFAPLCVFSLVFMAVIDRRKIKQLGVERWQEISAMSPMIPFALVISGRQGAPEGRDLVRVTLMATLAFVMIVSVHAALFDAFPFWLWL